MVISRVFSIVVAALLATWGLSSPARADFLYDLTVTGSWTGSGSIDFNTSSGSSTSGVSSFSFTSSNFAPTPPTLSYGLGDISSISWSINSAGDLTSLLLVTNQISFSPSPPDFSALLLTTNSTLTNPSPCESSQSLTGSIICEATGPGGGVILTNFNNAQGGNLLAVPVSPVPEPGSLALFVPPLLGLAFVYRRRRRA